MSLEFQFAYKYPLGSLHSTNSISILSSFYFHYLSGELGLRLEVVSRASWSKVFSLRRRISSIEDSRDNISLFCSNWSRRSYPYAFSPINRKGSAQRYKETLPTHLAPQTKQLSEICPLKPSFVFFFQAFTFLVEGPTP